MDFYLRALPWAALLGIGLYLVATALGFVLMRRRGPDPRVTLLYSAFLFLAYLANDNLGSLGNLVLSATCPAGRRCYDPNNI